MTPIIPPDTMLVQAMLDSAAVQSAFPWGMVVFLVVGALAGSFGWWGYRFQKSHPELAPEDCAFCWRCGQHFTPGAMYAEHMRACK